MLSIRTLNCRVTVATKKKRSPTAATAGPTQPSMAYREAPSASTGQSDPPEAETVAETPAPAAAKPTGGNVRSADPQQVADRVYEIVRDEIRLNRLRRGG